MSVLTDQPELIAIGAVYLRASALAFLLTGATQIYLCLMKNTGAAARGMTISVVGVLVHIALNVVLIFGPGPFPRLGVTGAAIALVVSRLLELAWAYGYSLRPGRPRARWASLLRSQGFLERQFWRYTLPVLGNMIAFGGGFTVYTMLMGRMGTDAVAANSIATIVKDLVICFWPGRDLARARRRPDGLAPRHRCRGGHGPGDPRHPPTGPAPRRPHPHRRALPVGDARGLCGLRDR
jgi:Na+-driven multidrug efflux pump